MATQRDTTHIIYSSVDSLSVDEMEYRNHKIRADPDWEEQVISQKQKKKDSNGQKAHS